jgi:hypothetical protein
MTEDEPRWTSANTPKVTASSIGTPFSVVTCAEIRMRWATVTALNR